MAEQAGGWSGDSLHSSGSRRPAIPGLVLVRRPRCRLATGTRAASGLRPEVLRPPARSWLTAALEAMLKARPGAVVRTPQQSVERRAGLRHWPVIFGRFPKIGPLARRTTGCGASAPAPVGALLPSFFWGTEKDKGHPAP